MPPLPFRPPSPLPPSSPPLPPAPPPVGVAAAIPAEKEDAAASLAAAAALQHAAALALSPSQGSVQATRRHTRPSPSRHGGHSRGPLRAECGLRSGRRDRLTLLRAFHALLCVPRHPLRSPEVAPVMTLSASPLPPPPPPPSHCGRPGRHRHLHRPRHRPRPHAAATLTAPTLIPTLAATVAAALAALALVAAALAAASRPAAAALQHASRPLTSSCPTALARRPPRHHRHLHRLALTATLPPTAQTSTDTPGPLRAATGRSRGPLRAECRHRSGRRERLSLVRAFHALLCVPKHALLFYSITHKTPPLPLSLDLGPCALGRGVARHARGSPAAWERAPARLAGGVRRTLSA